MERVLCQPFETSSLTATFSAGHALRIEKRSKNEFKAQECKFPWKRTSLLLLHDHDRAKGSEPVSHGTETMTGPTDWLKQK
eukprot:2521230-Amphidinium_carterae.1